MRIRVGMGMGMGMGMEMGMEMGMGMGIIEMEMGMEGTITYHKVMFRDNGIQGITNYKKYSVGWKLIL